MESLRNVAEKVKKSPQVIRKKLGGGGQYNTLNSTSALKEYRLYSEEPLISGIPFYVKRLGSLPVTRAQGTGCTDEAVKNIVQHCKKAKSFKQESKLQKVLLTVSTRKLTVQDMLTQEVLMDIPIYRVSYCTADPNYLKIFAFVAREKDKQTLACHAFLCNKDAMAQAMSLTVADAFKVAFESFESLKRPKRVAELHTKPVSRTVNGDRDGASITTSSGVTSNPVRRKSHDGIIGENGPTIDVTDVHAAIRGCDETVKQTTRGVRALDLASSDDFEDDFTRLAESRSSQNLFETPIRRSDFQGDVNNMMATEQTAKELMLSKSHEDLLLI